MGRRSKILMLVCACVVGILFQGSSIQALGDGKWGWFSAISAINKWSVVQGEATVRITEGVFFAELREQDSFLRITLKGTVRDGRIDAIAEQHATDDELRKLKGTYKKIKWKKGGGRESIVLTQPDEPWGLTIGLTRELPAR